MNTLARAAALADACQHFPFLGPSSTDDLLAMFDSDFGGADFSDAGTTVLHILAGNTPAAALQTLVRGLLVGAHNLAKVPSAGLPEVDAFIAHLPRELATRVETSRSLRDDWLACMGAPSDVCGPDCSVQLQDLRACVGMYCAGDPSFDPCQTLKSSF